MTEPAERPPLAPQRDLTRQHVVAVELHHGQAIETIGEAPAHHVREGQRDESEERVRRRGDEAMEAA